MFQTLPRLLSGKWSSIRSGHPWWSLLFPWRNLSLPQTSMSYSFCFCDTCNIRDLIIGIPIPSSISLLTLLFTRSCDILSPWPSHMLQHWMNLTEWAQSIFYHADEQISLLMHSPLPTPLETQETPFHSPVTWWWLMQSKPPPEVVIMIWSHGLRIRSQHFLLL
jgi:hypothetical protein